MSNDETNVFAQLKSARATLSDHDFFQYCSDSEIEPETIRAAFGDDAQNKYGQWLNVNIG